MSTTVSNVTSASSTTSTSSATTTTKTSNSTLDFDQWISLLTTELQYQDPSDPVSSSEYVSQMAQLSSLSEMENIYSSVNNVQAYSMIGKSVTYETTDSSGNTTQATGTVDSVIISNGTTYLSVGGTKVELSSVVKVADSTSSSSTSA